MAKNVCTFGDVPKGHHWMILLFETIHTPGDERSRTHPGHGYPASDDPVARCLAFTDEVEWKRVVEKLMNPANGARKDFYAAEVNPATITTSVSVTIGS